MFILGREAGDVYLKAGETEIKSGEADGSARKFINASTCYKKIDPECKMDIVVFILYILYIVYFLYLVLSILYYTLYILYYTSYFCIALISTPSPPN